MACHEIHVVYHLISSSSSNGGYSSIDGGFHGESVGIPVFIIQVQQLRRGNRCKLVRDLVESGSKRAPVVGTQR